MKIREDGALDRMRQTVRDAMSPHNTREEFRQLLKDDHIDAIFRINPVGRIYGVTFVDHEAGIVANGSVLGKAFSANAFNELYPAPKEELSTTKQESKHEQSSHPDENFVPNPIDAILDLADAQAYEEQQLRIQRRRKKHRSRG